MMGKILTVLVPVYNTEKYIRRCLDSIVLDEIIDDIEIIVVSDGSKDGSVEIVKEYVSRYPDSIVLIEKENGGHGSTINKGIEIASGKYFRVLDSDDWFDIFNFKQFVYDLKNTDVDLVITDYAQELIYNQQHNLVRYNKIKPYTEFSISDFDLELLGDVYFTMATSTYKLDILRKSRIHLIEKTFYVDMQYNIEPFKYIETFEYFNLEIYRYYIGRPDQSVNIKSFVAHKKDHEKVMKHLIDYYEDEIHNIDEQKQKYIEKILYFMLHTHYSIYCIYDKSNNARNEIIDFDAYLKEKSRRIYDLTNRNSFIRLQRSIKFYFKDNKKNLISISYRLLKKIKRDK